MIIFAKNGKMEAPFGFGQTTIQKNYINREEETVLLKNNFRSSVNTIILSPRKWGKTTLVNKVLEILGDENEKEMFLCYLDIFNCRSKEEFYTAYSHAVLKSVFSPGDEFVAGMRKYLGQFAPVVSFQEETQDSGFSFGVDLKNPNLSPSEILDLPQAIAKDTGKKMLVCIDEFQNILGYQDTLVFQQELCTYWKTHDKVCYCLLGSKQYLLADIFKNAGRPFYNFGKVFFLPSISRNDWIQFITNRFRTTGKHISGELSGVIVDTMKNHPYYIQQYSQEVWFLSERECTEDILSLALTGLIDQLSLLFATVVDSLTPRQISFLLAIASGKINFSSKEVLEKYDLGASANIKNLKKATLENDLIDILPGKRIVLQNPVFEYWLKNYYMESPKTLRY
jgi:hypothetical protein